MNIAEPHADVMTKKTITPPSKTQQWRIVVVTETWFPDINGVAHTIYKMVEEMLQHGHEVILIRPRQHKGEQPRTHTEGEVSEYLVPSFRLFWYPEVRLGLARSASLKPLLQRLQPDLVQVVTEGILGRAALLAAKQLQLPVISEYHTNFDQYANHYKIGFLTKLVQRYLRRLHNQADRVLVPTAELKTKLTEQGFQQLHIVSRGLDTELFNPNKRSQTLRQTWGINEDELAVVYVGRLAVEKNLDLAIEAFRAIQQQRLQHNATKSTFIIVGDGPERQRLQQQNPDFIFCGMQTGEDLAQHYASADLFLAPSLSETFGNTILEAMASQLAIVCFHYASAKEHLCHGKSALSVKFGNKTAFIDATVQLAQQAELRHSLAKQARHASASLSWQQTFFNFHHAIAPLIRREDASTRDSHYEVATSLK